MAKYEIVGKGKFLHREGGRDTSKLKLPPGAYQATLVDSSFGRTALYQSFKTTHDQLVELPTREYRRVCNEIEVFLSKTVENNYKEMGFIYKRGMLLHGKPGTGKTCLINRIVDTVINEKKGIVLFNPQVSKLKTIFNSLETTNPDTFVMVVWEEFDQLGDDSTLLSLLDGEIQKNKVLYLATTNNFKDIAKRLLRPGRFTSIIEVKTPNRKCREIFLNAKFGDKLDDMKQWLDKTDGFNIDQLKDAVISVSCLGLPFEKAIKRLQKETKIGIASKLEDESEEEEELEFSEGIAKSFPITINFKAQRTRNGLNKRK